MIPQSLQHLFVKIGEQRELTGDRFSVFCSFIQIYNEKLFDLYQDKNVNPLTIHEEKREGIFVEGLSEYEVRSAEECFTLLKRGENNRITRETRFNMHSSRSHTVFSVLIEIETKKGTLKRVKLNLCDLAGSEKLDFSDKLGEKHMEEHKAINLSLTCLGLVIAGLAKNNPRKFIPYRDSKLTRLLKDSLGGKGSNCQTILLATISPLLINQDESISTLKFADRAKQVMIR